MTQALDQSILELLNASQDDEQTMLLPVPDRVFGFHAQQAVEKLLKALIGAHEQRFEYTHNIRALVEQVQGLDETLPVDLNLIESLTAYAGVWRYQEPNPLLAKQRVELEATVSTLRIFTLIRLQALRPEPNWASLCGVT